MELVPLLAADRCVDREPGVVQLLAGQRKPALRLPRLADAGELAEQLCLERPARAGAPTSEELFPDSGSAIENVDTLATYVASKLHSCYERDPCT